MSDISRISLDDTLHLLQLVRETALARSRQAVGSGQTPAAEKMNGLASRLEPVVEQIKELRGSSAAPKAEAAAGILGQADFQRLLEARKTAGGRAAQMAQEAKDSQKPAESIHTRTVQAFQNAQAAQATLSAATSQQGPGAVQSARPAQSAQPASSPASAPAPVSLTSTLDRNRMISAMASANMNELEIARQFGMSREEVRLVLNLQQKSTSTNEVIR
jgi:hypothetical protein